MASISEIHIDGDIVPTKKPRSNNRKALIQKNAQADSSNVVAQKESLASMISTDKENPETLSKPGGGGKKGKGAKAKQTQSFEKDMQEMQDMLQKMTIEKEKTEELLKEKDEILKKKDEEQEKMKIELKKLQKMKEFKPSMSLDIGHFMNDKEQDKKGKKKKDCPERKRPTPIYILWCKDQWAEVKKENPDAEFKEISNILGAKWKNVTAEEKKPYEESYLAAKEAYLKVVTKERRENEGMKLLEEDQKQKTAMELLEQYLQFKQESEKDNKKNKKEKDPLKPKHPISAYFLFASERRKALLAENKNVWEAAKITGEEWKSMTEEQKAPYEEIATENKERYFQEMEAYRQKKEEESMELMKEEEELMKLHKQEGLQLLKKKEKTETLIKKTKEDKQKKKLQQNIDPNKPKKPASSYFLFSKEARKTLLEEKPGTNFSTLSALISVKWKELSEEEKQVWNAKAAEGMEAYKKELEEYNKSIVVETVDNKKKGSK